jgi:ankyrin repeat protein
VRALLDDSRTDRAWRDDDGATVLHRAAEEGHTKMVELLVAAGVDAHARDARGRTAAERAALGGHPELAARIETLVPSL